MRKILKMLKVAEVVAVIMGFAAIGLVISMMVGCDGSGGMGGQGLSFKDITVAEGGHFEVKVDIEDGGTLSNPSVGVGREPTTQPSK